MPIGLPLDEGKNRTVFLREYTPAAPPLQVNRAAGLTERNAQRLFHRELGTTFGQWRRQLRLLLTLERLAYGESVTNVALDVGYSDVSAFIAMSKAALSVTPAQYFRRK